MIKIITNNHWYSDEQVTAIITEMVDHFKLRKGIWSFHFDHVAIQYGEGYDRYLGGVTVSIE